jgi:CheY-like chemotaxis protein
MVVTRILIVEDQGILALDLEDILTRLGYEVVDIVIDAEGAQQAIRKSLPDLVIMDIRLRGGIDGVEAAQRIWDEFKLPVLFLTASVDEGTLRQIRATQAVGYVTKPFRVKELREAIEKALQVG